MKILAALLLSLALPVIAGTLEGRVVGVSDGDTITILDRQNVQHRIRLSAIDAPEKAQPFGNRSKEHLSKWVYNRSVLVEWNKRDRYGRIVGPALCRACCGPQCSKKAPYSAGWESGSGPRILLGPKLYSKEIGESKSKKLPLRIS